MRQKYFKASPLALRAFRFMPAAWYATFVPICAENTLVSRHTMKLLIDSSARVPAELP